MRDKSLANFQGEFVKNQIKRESIINFCKKAPMFQQNLPSTLNFPLMKKLLVLLLSMSFQQVIAQEKTNVLFIAIDDLNDWVGFLQGHPNTKTPNMDRLAARGMVFSNAHCPATVCAPSRAAIMSGMQPASTGVYGQIRDQDLKERLDKSHQIIFLPDYFEQHGYKTMGVGKLFHQHDGAKVFGEFGGIWEKFGPKPKERFEYDPAWFDKPGGTQTDWGAFPDTDEKMPDYKIAKWAVEKLNESHEKPFFLGVGFIRPHVPFYVPQKWFDLFEGEKIQLPPYLKNDLSDVPDISKRVHDVPMMPTTEWAIQEGHWQDMVRAYLACIAFVDAQVGEVLDALEASPYVNNTLIVLWSDHGYHIGEKNRFAKHSLWERTTHVPLIFAGKGIERSGTCSASVGLIDLYPSLLELSGLPANSHNEGHSLVPLLQKPQRKWPYAARTTYGKGNHSIHFGNYHYIQYADGSAELYDRKTDPNEWKNLAPLKSSKRIIKKLQKHLPTKEAPYHPDYNFMVNNYFREVSN